MVQASEGKGANGEHESSEEELNADIPNVKGRHEPESDSDESENSAEENEDPVEKSDTGSVNAQNKKPNAQQMLKQPVKQVHNKQVSIETVTDASVFCYIQISFFTILLIIPITG